MSNPDDERRQDAARDDGHADHDGQQPEVANDPFAVPSDADHRGENPTAVYDTEAFDTSRDGGTNDTEVFDGEHEPAAEPPVDFGSDESVPADRPAVDFGSDESAPADRPAVDFGSDGSESADRPAVDFGDGGAAADRTDDGVPDELRDVERDPDFASNEQRAGDDSLEAPGTPPATIDIDHPDASDTRPNPMVDAPAVQDASSDDDSTTSGLPTGTDAPHSSDARHDDQGDAGLPAVSDADRTDADRSDRTEAPTAAYERFPAAAAAPPLVEPAKPVEPERTTPIGAYVPLDTPVAAPTSPVGSPVDDTDRADTDRADADRASDAETTRFPTAAPLPPVVQDRQPEPVGTGEPVRGNFPEPTPAAVPTPITHEDVLERQREAYAGFKWGSGFYGAIAMTGVFVLLSAIVGLGAGLFGVGNMQTISDGGMGVESIVLAIVIAVILFVSAMCGGYVAGRMARFAGVKQGLATWFWGLFFVVVGGLLGWAYGANRSFDMGNGNSKAMALGFQGDNGVLIGIGAIVVVLALTLLGAIAGGALGMPYHRRVDRAGFDTHTD